MRYTIKNFLPLIIIFFIIFLFAITRQLYTGSWSLINSFTDFMAAYFILFGVCKLITFYAFAKRYQTYDLISQYNLLYAYAYPGIEIALGALYLYRLFPIITNGIVFVLMLSNSISIAIALNTADNQTCVCLGTLFPTPLTYITLLKNVLIASIALGMLLYLIL